MHSLLPASAARLAKTLWLVISMVILFGPTKLLAQISPEAVALGKAATALVEVGDADDVTATAFCIDAGGLFVTNAHVVEADAQLKLVVNAGRTGQVILPAKVLRVSKANDLALLQAEGAKDLSALELGRDDGLMETMELVAFGYPFGKEKAVVKGEEFPSVSVNIGRITSLRTPQGKLATIQLDVVLNPGNSGGPVLDKSGRLIGIVQGGIRGAGINFAIPVGRLAEMLESPTILLETGGLSYNTRLIPSDWTIRLVPASKVGDATVVVTIETDSGDPRTFTAYASGKQDGVYVARVTPFAGESVSQALLTLNASFAKGLIEGRVVDQPFKVASKTLKLSECRTIRSIPKPLVLLRDGTELEGTPDGLGAVAFQLGAASATLDLGLASQVEIQAPPSASLALKCTISVVRGTDQVASLDKSFSLSQQSDETTSRLSEAGSLSIIQPPQLAADQEVLKLPGTVTDVAVGAGGRLLLLTMKDIKKLAVFDTNVGKVVRLLALPSEAAIVAAGSQKFLVVSPEQGILQRWNLGTLERERTATLSVEGAITAMAMGSRSVGPAMVFLNGRGFNGIQRAEFGFIDPETLKIVTGFDQQGTFMNQRQNVIPKQEKSGIIFVPHFSSATERVQLRGSPGGEVFTAWSTTHSPAGALSFVWKDKKSLTYYYQHSDMGHVVPGPDGRILFTGSAGMLNETLQGSRTETLKQSFVPSNGSNYYLGLEGKQASLYIAGNYHPLAAVGELTELFPDVGPPSRAPRLKDPNADKRIQFIPDANLLVTIPPDKDELVLRKVAPIDLLNKAQADYLFVESRPITEAIKGKEYAYQLKVKSRVGGVKYELSSGPEGMTISPEGRLTWTIPVDIPDKDVTPIILIKDVSGQDIYHTFTLRLR